VLFSYIYLCSKFEFTEKVYLSLDHHSINVLTNQVVIIMKIITLKLIIPYLTTFDLEMHFLLMTLIISTKFSQNKLS